MLNQTCFLQTYIMKYWGGFFSLFDFKISIYVPQLFFVLFYSIQSSQTSSIEILSILSINGGA
jgi:hypothetical protein